MLVRGRGWGESTLAQGGLEGFHCWCQKRENLAFFLACPGWGGGEVRLEKYQESNIKNGVRLFTTLSKMRAPHLSTAAPPFLVGKGNYSWPTSSTTILTLVFPSLKNYKMEHLSPKIFRNL